MSQADEQAERIRAALAGELAGADRRAVDDLAIRLAAAYAAPDRAYHNLAHIASMLDLHDRQAASGATSADRRAVVLAILFHDVIYDAMRSDNEEQSAAFAAAELGRLGIDAALVARVADLVRATAHGIASAVDNDPARALLVDLDLAILGAAPDAYDAYADAVRREYAHVTDADWRTGRARVLDHFLGLTELYATPALARLWTGQARRNLRRERDSLRS